MESPDDDWGTHEGIMRVFSKALASDGVTFTMYAPQAHAVVSVWDSEFHDYTVCQSVYPTYRDLCKRPFIVPHAAVVDKQVRRLARGAGPPLNVTRYFAAAVLALRESTFQQQVRSHQRERLGGDE